MHVLGLVGCQFNLRPRSAGMEEVSPAEFYCSWMIFSHKFLQIHPNSFKFLPANGAYICSSSWHVEISVLAVGPTSLTCGLILNRVEIMWTSVDDN